DFYKVLINASTAWLYGCAAANGTLLGYGERTGNTPLEGLVFEYAGLMGGLNGMDATAITEIAEYMERECQYPIPASQPFVGRAFNATSAGIHADGAMKNEEIYNIFDTGALLNRPPAVNVTDRSCVELRPVEIAMRRFSRTPFGLDPKEVREFLAEVAAAVDRLNSELAKISMERKTAGTGADELRRQLEAANAKIAEYHQQESLLSKAVLDVQKVTEEMTEGSRAEAERIVADAKAAAEEMMQTARKEAADLLRDARARGQGAVHAAERAAATQV